MIVVILALLYLMAGIVVGAIVLRELDDQFLAIVGMAFWPVFAVILGSLALMKKIVRMLG